MTRRTAEQRAAYDAGRRAFLVEERRAVAAAVARARARRAERAAAVTSPTLRSLVDGNVPCGPSAAVVVTANSANATVEPVTNTAPSPAPPPPPPSERAVTAADLQRAAVALAARRRAEDDDIGHLARILRVEHVDDDHLPALPTILSVTSRNPRR